ncbi:MAG: cyclic nucleotide-binding domain-containing protein [Candidatus Margulisbacteria bacterium]|nr:cyclic nucleotide-binding domain-containing protein [Candidatus Margulisiibacteriota bacterium]
MNIHFLKDLDLFQQLPDSILELISSKMVLETFRAGQIIFHEGDYANRFYLISEGQISILIENKQGAEVILANLKKGEIFGEMALLIDSYRTATARADIDCQLYYLLKKDFQDLLTQHHVVALELSKTLSQRLALTNQLLLQQKQATANMKRIKNIPWDILHGFKHNMTQTDYKKGSLIFEEGDYGDSMFLIEAGEVEISVTNKKGESVVLTVLKKGDFFGEMAMLTDSYRTAKARASSECRLACLTKKDFNNLMETNQLLALELSKVLSKRLSSTNRIITQQDNNRIILILAQDKHQPQIKHLLEYLQSITSRQVVRLKSNGKQSLGQEINNYQNSYIIIENTSLMHLDTAHDIINFQENVPGQYHVAENTSKAQIEAIIRKIAHKTIGLALSSGTAPGLAHIGVLKILQENGVPIDYIAGTSGGALYGAAYAFGNNFPKVYQAFARSYKQPLYRLWDPVLPISGIFHGKKLINKTIKKLVGNKNIEDSVIPFAAVATDLYSGQEVIMTRGSVLQAIRASLSIPIIFTPVKSEDKLLVDGVVTTPVPISALEKANIDIKVAVYVSDLNAFKKNDMLSVFLRSRNISSDFIADESIGKADIIIKPLFENLRQFDYGKIDEIIAIGEEESKKSLGRIQRLLQK